MDWLTELVPPTDTRVPLSLQSFTQLFLPSLLLYYSTAALVIIPNTLYARLALLPVTLWSAWRTGTRLDLAAPYHDERLIYLNQGLTLAISTLAIRAVIWTFQLEPFYKTPDPDAPRPPKQSPFTVDQVACDAFDLCCNLRGIGWNWSKGLRIAKETRPTHSRIAFALSTFQSFVATLLLFDVLHYTVQSFSWSTLGSAAGGTIFDPQLSPIPRYLRSTLITYLAGLTICCGIQLGFYMASFTGVVLFRNDPASWPPIFNAPWLATSLAEFWAQRWHQVFRDLFVSCGSKPLAAVFGRMGTVLGAFLISGLLHVAGLWGMGRGTEFWTVAGYFLMMGVGIVLERVWRNATGHKVGGALGWVWTMLWVVCWGNFMVDAWARKGLIGSVFFPDESRPMYRIERIVSDILQ
ncbi:hypothetical protein D9611_000117 [Ephemerocybe angulata]|uniref:Wax synthase domain-containing protein n=1 Tax=Ephemerocybe angulata TaxID=980116 RepID=A0A8H5BNE9_9AGAR|nr:hypothetical protein D9611_000117 [Tulosesus angulatus]